MNSERDGQPLVEKIFSDPPTPETEPVRWWQRYQSALTSLSTTSREVLRADCKYIVEKGIFGGGRLHADGSSATDVRRGLVVGSVQSGKTASMLGTIASSLDDGVDIVILLAGTRISLWHQTYNRVLAQLDHDLGEYEKQRRRVLLPKVAPTESIAVAERYSITPVRVGRAFERRQPIIVVALKHSSHLHSLRNSLAASVFPEVEKLGRPVHMLVIDDEADDGSILDAAVENAVDPIHGNLKQIPRGIADLWDPPAGSVPSNLIPTYVGYTATPQANFLQEDQNPLSPKDFVVALRTPLDRGEVGLRSSTYTEPLGIKHYYTGGEVFYRRVQSGQLCVPTNSSPGSDMEDALRSFLIAGAIQLYRAGNVVGPNSARGTQFDSAEDALAGATKPHAMLIHPSPLVEDHFSTALDILELAGAERGEAAGQLRSSTGAYLSNRLSADLSSRPEKWNVWLDRFRDSSDALIDEFAVQGETSFPNWETVQTLLADEVIPGTRVAVVNSDPSADDRPEYEPAKDQDGKWAAPRDLSTIFVAGNVMSRGLTLEGLTTTVFLRSAANPVADTQMQMQRWFGYRGANLELCRVFASQDQIDFWAEYHDMDEALKSVIFANMSISHAPRLDILQGPAFFATGKIANLGHLPLHPGRKPFVAFVNEGKVADPNAKLVAELFSNFSSHEVMVGERSRGRALDKPFTLLEAAGLLDQLRYSSYAATGESQLATLWAQVQTRLASAAPLPDGTTLYSPPVGSGHKVSASREACPYRIPAYLRLWHYALTRHVRGLFVTGEPGQLWSMADLLSKTAQSPLFTVGIRYGGANSRRASGFFDALDFDVLVTNRDIKGGIAQNSWGSNNPSAGDTGYLGDEYFDYYARNESIPDQLSNSDRWRNQGSFGQILFYVNQPAGQRHPSISLGVCIPSGGPDQFSATVAGVNSK